MGTSDKPVRDELERLFEGLASSPFQVTSPASATYNCIAWAAGDDTRWWWPARGFYWPPGVPKVESLPAFQKAFAAMGYTHASNGHVEPGWEKVALYADADGIPTHAARQLDSGAWTSKLGQLSDISHTLAGLERSDYGTVALILRRPRRGAAPETGTPAP